MDKAIYSQVPLGQENATTARHIWQQIDMGSIAGVKGKLNKMVEDGLLERQKRVPGSWGNHLLFQKNNLNPAQARTRLHQLPRPKH
jgi:hypothetical protein